MRDGFRWLIVLAALGPALAASAWGQPASDAVTSTDSAGEEPAAPLRTPSASAPSPGPAAAAPDSTKTIAGPPVAASQLDTFLLRDSKGNLVPVLGLPFEEFEQLLRLKKGLAPPPAPGYTLDALSMTGTAEGSVANLQLTATIRVRDEGWVRVPLEMPRAVVRQAPKYEGPGEHFLTFDAASGGYLVWLKGAGAKPHVISMPISVGLSSSNDQAQLALHLPRATEASLRLSVPEERVEASATEGILTTSAAKGRTEISVLGPSGNLELRWRKGRSVVVPGPVQLDASGDVVVTVESEQRITSDARLRVRSYGGPLETFQVRLPAGMALVPIPPTGYTLTPALPMGTGTQASGEDDEGQVVDVRLDKPATGTVEVRLLTTLQADAGPTSALRPAHFEVLGAVRQRGTIDFDVAGEWQLDWTEDATVRRLDLTADPARPRLVARYEYFRQPCGLRLKVSARPSRISVEPTHRIDVEAQQVRVQTTLKYRFRGARATGLSFDLGDWKFDRLVPDDLFDLPSPKSEAAGKLEVPFRLGAIAPSELELTLEAHRMLTPGAEEISITLPRPVTDIVAPASVVIAPADNVELTPQTARSIGLSPDPSGLKIPSLQQAPLVYRDLGGGEPALFSAALRVRKRTTTTAARAVVRLDRQQIQVEQQLDYRIAHEPQRTFTLVAPRSLAAAGNLQVRLNGELLGVTPLADPPTAATSMQRLQFTAPTDQIGLVPVSVRYTVPMRNWDGQASLPLAIPLVVPADEIGHQFAGQHIAFALGDGIQIEPDPAGVDEFSRPTPQQTNGAEQAFTWSKAAPMTRWTVRPSSAGPSASLHVGLAWVQTWLAADKRHERAAFRLSTTQETLRVRLPAGADPSRVAAAINAQEVAAQPRDPGMVRIDLPAAVRGRDFVLELWYSLDVPGRHAGWRSERLQAAVIEGGGPPRRLYWQLLLPEDEHLVALPTGLAPEMAWSAEHWFVARSPTLDQRQIEGLLGASRQPLLPRGANEYLFGALGQAPSLSVVAVHRRLLLASASGSVLLLGLALVHVPRLRHPLALLVLAVGLGALALAFPDLALLAGQMALLGILVALAAAVWAWLGLGRTLWTPSHPREVSARPRETASTHSPLSKPERSSPLSTATAPAILAGTAAEARQ